MDKQKDMQRIRAILKNRGLTIKEWSVIHDFYNINIPETDENLEIVKAILKEKTINGIEFQGLGSDSVRGITCLNIIAIIRED